MDIAARCPYLSAADGFGVRGADFAHGGIGIAGETAARIGTEQRQPFPLAKMVPEMFKADGRSVKAPRPKQRDHFTKSAHTMSARTGAIEDARDLVLETVFVRPIVDHEFGKRVVSIESDVLIARARRGDEVEMTRPKALLQSGQMLRRGDQHDNFLLAQTANDKLFERLKKFAFFLVELNHMLTRSDFTPKNVFLLFVRFRRFLVRF